MNRSELKNVLEMVNSWLKFAESKHGVLLALCLAAVAASKDLAKDSDALLVISAKGIFYVSIFAAAGFSLRSFFPRLSESHFLPKRSGQSGVVNPIYYGAIASMTADEYEELIVRLINDEKPLGDWERAYVQQIKVNSQIALAKFEIFSAAASCAVVGLGALAVLCLAAI